MGNASNEQQKREERQKGSKTTKRKWTRKEDEALIVALYKLCGAGWKRDNGIFKSGYTAVLEKEMKSKLPGCNLKASPHIESRLKTLKKHCDAITDMRVATGIQWNNQEQTVECEDDDVWEDWVKAHSDAKGLRNKPFLYYDDLCLIFGKNRGNQKGVENALDADKELNSEEANNSVANLMGAERFNGKNRDDDKGVKIEYADNELNHEANNNAENVLGADGSNGKNRANGKGVENVLGPSIEPDHNEVNGHAENVMGADGSNDADVLVYAVEGTQIPMQGGATSTKSTNKKRSRSSDSWSSGLGEIAKIFGNFLEKYEEQFSLLVELMGREAAADKVAAEKRARLNGELTKLPNLGLQARLRAASLIVSDPPKLDFFFSLPNNERREWVLMVLGGLI